MKKKRGGFSRSANNIKYHGLVIDGNLNVNALFTNFVNDRRIKNVPDPTTRSALIKTINYIINKRKNILNKNRNNLKRTRTNSQYKRLSKRIIGHEWALGQYKILSNHYRYFTPIVAGHTFHRVYKDGKNVTNLVMMRR